MSRIQVITIPRADTVEQLRQALNLILNQIITQINTSSIDTNIDIKGNRITGLGEPASLTDATTKRYVDAAIKALGRS